MRFFKNQITAATKARHMPFSGLGFAMDAVQDVAQAMIPTPHIHEDCRNIAMPAPDFVAQPSGYSLLVTLSREIRGR